MALPVPLRRTLSIARKEVLHVLRDRQALLFILCFPIIDLVTLGYAIDTSVRHIPTVVFGQARTQESLSIAVVAWVMAGTEGAMCWC